MSDDFPFDAAIRFAAADDELHPAGPEWDWTETAFWSFHVPERELAGWIYVAVRPNIGTVAGGAFVYDPSGWLPWEARYYAYLHHQQLDPNLDLRKADLPTGVSIRCLAPGMRYSVGYRLPGRDRFLADLEFEGITEPVPHVSGKPPFTEASHYDQHGRITGTITLDGETVPVDCISVRDRSWGRRQEVREHDLQMSYCFGATSERDAFLAFTMPDLTDPTSETEQLYAGYLLRDGVLRNLAELTRTNRRDGDTGGVASFDVSGADTDGRALTASATALSRTPLLVGTEVAIMSYLRWDVAGTDGYGEDQSVYPNAHYLARRLAAR